MDSNIERALSEEVLTSFKTSALLEAHIKSLKSSTLLKNSSELTDIYVCDLCNSLGKLVDLDGHICRVKDENYTIHRISMVLINDAIPYFLDVYNSFLNNTKEIFNINDLAADYSKEEVFCIRLELNHLKSQLVNRKKDIEVIVDGISKLEKSKLLTKVFEHTSSSELVAMTEYDFEEYLESQGCSEDDIVRLSTLRGLLGDNEVLQTAVFITQEPVLDIYSLSLEERLLGARVQILTQDLEAIDRFLGIV